MVCVFYSYIHSLVHAYVYESVCVEVRGQFSSIDFLLPPSVSPLMKTLSEAELH